ncbi:MAG: glycosyltransferase family 2 protein [Coriobacteriia bacterium]|jgi:Glycosyltransferases involved in cell wall biogenesis
MREMAPPPRDAVVVPVYNEAPRVREVLRAVREVFGDLLIVVDDGSDDGTGCVLAEREDIVLVRHGHNEGYGRALADGLRYAASLGVERIVTMDCDGQHEPKHIPEFLRLLTDTRADVVSGSRYLPGSVAVGAAPADRRAVNAQVTEMINERTGWGLTDAFCGFKAYRADAIAGLPLEEPGYALPLELWARAWARGLTVVEAPVERIYNDQDRSFGEDLDDPVRRLGYYKDVWMRTLEEESV